MTKSELRQTFLAKRQSLKPSERRDANAKIVDNFFNSYDLLEIKVLHCFVSIERFGEVQTAPIFQRLWLDFPDIKTVVPRINRVTHELESLRYGPDVELVRNNWQIGEPMHNEYIEPIDIDVVLLPLICFDRDGHRVGYGKGYYDRLLARCRDDCEKIGLSNFPPVDVIDDSYEGDIKLDRCITPVKIFDF